MDYHALPSADLATNHMIFAEIIAKDYCIGWNINCSDRTVVD